MSIFKKIILTLSLVAGIGLFSFSAVGATAVNPFADTCANNPDSAVCQNQDSDLNAMIKVIINTILYILGAISVIMIIYGGFRYTVSGGDAAAVANAKNTILYSVVGLVVAILAFAIVNFVITALA